MGHPDGRQLEDRPSALLDASGSAGLRPQRFENRLDENKSRPVSIEA